MPDGSVAALSPAAARLLGRTPLLSDPRLCVTRPVMRLSSVVWIDRDVPLYPLLSRGAGVAQRVAPYLEPLAQPVPAVHVLALGRPGCLQWHGEIITAESDFSAGVAGALALACRSALLPSGNLVLQASRVAQGEAGQALIRALEGALDRSVSASAGLVGSPLLGGRWLGAPGVPAGALPLDDHTRARFDDTLCLPDAADIGMVWSPAAALTD